MSKLTRAFVMTGVAVAASLAVAVSPASASPAGPKADEASGKPVASYHQAPKFRERIFDYYHSPRTCAKVGKTGVWKEKWARYQCFQVWRGFHRGEWALKVYSPWYVKGGQGYPKHYGQNHDYDYDKGLPQHYDYKKN
ncbi:hypothetical protein AB0M02_35235 [Actinoplanes sp. NPDC051861]|uniref:hypothetical protein n=1 Tax=Actinoplanes sp. NPDC051861 TaxID=3155170 RepID=UPI00342E24A2